MIKVLSVLPQTSSPAGMIFTRRLIASLEETGVENRYFYIPSSNMTIAKAFKSGRDLRKAVAEFHPDVVHVHYGMIYAFITSFSVSRPVIITFHGSDINTLPKESLRKKIVKKTLSNLSILRCFRAICVSRRVKDNFWWQREKGLIVPLGININEFYPIEREIARADLDLDLNEKIILFNANNPVVKRLDIATETLEIVRKTFPEARMEVISGNTGSSKIPMLLNACDCLLICSDSEGSPTMVKEAMACNIPIAGVDVGDVAERLNGVDNCYIAQKDPASLAGAIIEVLRNDRRSNGREKLIADDLTEERVARRILGIYESAV